MQLIHLTFILLGLIAVTSSRPIESTHDVVETGWNHEQHKNSDFQPSSVEDIITPHSGDASFTFTFRLESDTTDALEDSTTHTDPEVKGVTPAKTANDAMHLVQVTEPTTDDPTIERRRESFKKWIKHAASKVAGVAKGAVKLATHVL